MNSSSPKITPTTAQLLLSLIPSHADSCLVVGNAPREVLELLRQRTRLRVAAATASTPSTTLYDVLICIPALSDSSLASATQYLSPEGRLILLSQVSTPLAAAEMGKLGMRLHDQREGDSWLLSALVHAAYNPLDHAIRLGQEGKPAWGHEVLEGLSADYLRTPEAVINIFSERMLLLLQWAKSSPLPDLAAFATRAQNLFNHLCALEPQFHAAYQCRAEFWRLIGRDDMARRLLQNIEYVQPSVTVRRQLASLSLRPSPAQGFQLPEDWESPPPDLRILYLLHPRPHYGLDVLYDGLCKVLGEQNVIDYPQKPWLHGTPPDSMTNYPCTFSHSSRETTEVEILDLLASGAFDAVIYGDVEEGLSRTFARSVAELSKTLPFFLLDQVDEPVDMRGPAQQFMGRESCTAYFKREMVRGLNYGPGVFPLPFAYPDHLCLAGESGPRDTPLFWAGHRASGMRRLYLEHLERRLNRRLDQAIPPDLYRQAMREHVAGLSLFGFGFDTVRYWELPANGCLLLSERLPIEVPADFTNGENAVLFDTLAELDHALDWLTAEPGQARHIAELGHQHSLRFHTGSARAKQMLSWMCPFL